MQSILSLWIFFIDDQLIDLATLTTEDFYWELNMKNGVLTRSYTVTTPSNKVRLSFERFFKYCQK